MKRALVAVLVVVVLAAVVIGGVYAAVVRPILLLPAAAPGAESALATPDVLVLADLNVKQAAFLERWYLGTPVITAAHDALPPAPERTLVQHLRAMNVDVRRDVDYALWALYPSDTPAPRSALLLLGRFDARAIAQYLTRELGATSHAESGWSSYDVTRKDPVNCEVSTTWRVTADAQWVLLSDLTSHSTLLQRLTTVPTDSAAVVSWWHPLAQWDVLGVGVWNLPGIGTAVAHPLLQASAKSVEATVAPFEHAYFGLGIETAPPGGRLWVVLDARDPNRAAERITAWRQAVAASRARWVSAMPSLGALYDRLALTTTGGRSTLAFSVDRHFASNLRQVGNELLGAFLGGFGGHLRTSAPSERAEQIDATPFNFQPVASAAALPTYDPTVRFAEDVDQVSGPFGVRLAAVRLGSAPDSGLELTVEAFGNRIPNSSSTAQNARLLIDSVKAADGTELLRTEDCGRDRNAEPVTFTEAIAPRLKAAKTVRLVPGADPRALGSVAGHVELRLPTRTETVSLSHPGAGNSVRKRDATFTITDVNAGAVSYQISGPRGQILAFRAFNAKGQPLATESSFTADFVFGDGLAGETVYAGSVDRVDVVFAIEEQALRFPFALTDFSFTAKPTNAVPDATPAFQGYGAQAIGRALKGGRRTARIVRAAPGTAPDAPEPVKAPPFELSLDRTRGFITLVLDFTVRSTALPDFDRAFTVGELRVTRLRLKDGTVVDVGPLTATAPIHFGSSAKDGALSTLVHMTTDAKVRPDMLAAVEGRLTVQFPRTLETLRLEDLGPGATVRSRDFDVTVTGRGRGSLILQASHDGERLLYVRLLNADGQPLAFFGPQIIPLPDGTWRFELSPLGSPRGADVIVAPTLYRKAYPFVIATH